MPSVKIDLPEKWVFSIDIPVRITDINYGNHLGNDSFLSLFQEARVRWLNQFGWTELISENAGLIMVDVAVRFKSEAHFGDVLRIKIAPVEWTKRGFDLVYLAENSATGSEVARARSGFLFFDYASRKIAAVPEGFREKVDPEI